MVVTSADGLSTGRRVKHGLVMENPHLFDQESLRLTPLTAVNAYRPSVTRYSGMSRIFAQRWMSLSAFLPSLGPCQAVCKCSGKAAVARANILQIIATVPRKGI